MERRCDVHFLQPRLHSNTLDWMFEVKCNAINIALMLQSTLVRCNKFTVFGWSSQREKAHNNNNNKTAKEEKYSTAVYRSTAMVHLGSRMNGLTILPIETFHFYSVIIFVVSFLKQLIYCPTISTMYASTSFIVSAVYRFRFAFRLFICLFARMTTEEAASVCSLPGIWTNG